MKNAIARIIRRLNDEMAAAALAQEGQHQMAMEIISNSSRKTVQARRNRMRPEVIRPAMEASKGK